MLSNLIKIIGNQKFGAEQDSKTKHGMNGYSNEYERVCVSGGKWRNGICLLHNIFPVNYARKIPIVLQESNTKKSDIKPSIGSIWPIWSDFHFYLWPPEQCHTVVLCTTPSYSYNINSSYWEGELACRDDKLVFKTYEQTVTVSNGQTEQTYHYLTPLVSLSRSEEVERRYSLEVWSDYDGVEVTDPDKTIFFKVPDEMSVLLLTSSFSNEMKMSDDGLDYIRSRNTESHKTTSSLFFEGQLTAEEIGEELDCCPKPWIFENFLSSDDWFASRHHLRYTQYTLRKALGNTNCRNVPEKDTERQYSIKVEMGANCDWLRICFETNDATEGMCMDPKRSLDLIYGHHVYIPTDSDSARQFGTVASDLRSIRLSFRANNVVCVACLLSI
uniref:FBA_1 domain-containing protein n=1 Tax=Heterorhabditis bacteriophora TaxID=37862 RepID=A0A1I7WTC4_HETBA